MTTDPVAATTWPPAFSPAFLADARRRLDDHHVMVVVADVGTNRVELIDQLATAHAQVRWADATLTMTEFATLQALFPDLDLGEGVTVRDAAQRLRRHLPAPCVVVVLDADLRDTASVETLVRCADDGVLRLIVSVSPSGVDSMRWGSDPARIDLEPLESLTVARLLEERFDARPHATVVTMLQERAVGAYSVLRDVAELAIRRGEVVVASGVMMLGPSVDDAQPIGTGPGFDDHLPARTLADDHPARDVLRTVAFMPRLAWADAEAIFTGRELRAALRAGVAHRQGDVLVLGNPIDGLTRRHRLPEAERRRLLERVRPHLNRSRRLPRPALHAAEWITSVGDRVDAELATVAISQANRENRYHAAVTIADAVEPTHTWPSRLVVEHVYALHCVGRRTEAVERLRTVDPDTVHHDDLIEFLYWCVALLPEEDTDDVVGRAIDTAIASGSDARVATVELAQLVAGMFQGADDRLVAGTEELLASGRLSTVNQAVAHTLLAVAHRHRGRLDASVTSATEACRLLESTDAASYHRDFALETTITSLLARGDLDEAAARLVEYGSPGSAYGNFGRFGTALWGSLEYTRGDLVAALACAETSVARMPPSDPLALRGWVQASTAQILAQLGRSDAARAALSASSTAPSTGRVIHDLERWTAQARAHDLLGDPERAIGLLETVHAQAGDHALTWYAIQSAALLVQIEGPVRLDLLQQTTAGLTDLSGAAAWWQRFGDAMAANDMRALVALAIELHDRGMVVIAAEVAQFTLDVARRAADMSPAERDRLRGIAAPMQHRHVER